MDSKIRSFVCSTAGASDCFETETIQSLWSGYGVIVRYDLEGASLNQVVVKHVKPTDERNHRRGWNTDRSHQQKLKPYQVETAWNKLWRAKCDSHCRELYRAQSATSC